MENKSARALTCPECGGDFSASDLLDGDSVVTCLNCGRKYSTSEIFHQSTEEKVEEIRSRAYTDVEKDRMKAYTEVEEGKRKLEHERLQFEYEKLKQKNKEKQQKERSKHLKVIIPIVASFLGIALIVLSVVGFALSGFNSDPDAIRIGISYEDLEGMHYSEVVELLEDKGFTNITTTDDGWNLFQKSGTVKSVSIDGCSEFYGFSKFLPEDLVIIYYYS